MEQDTKSQNFQGDDDIAKFGTGVTDKDGNIHSFGSYDKNEGEEDNFKENCLIKETYQNDHDLLFYPTNSDQEESAFNTFNSFEEPKKTNQTSNLNELNDSNTNTNNKQEIKNCEKNPYDFQFEQSYDNYNEEYNTNNYIFFKPFEETNSNCSNFIGQKRENYSKQDKIQCTLEQQETKEEHEEYKEYKENILTIIKPRGLLKFLAHYANETLSPEKMEIKSLAKTTYGPFYFSSPKKEDKVLCNEKISQILTEDLLKEKMMKANKDALKELEEKKGEKEKNLKELFDMELGVIFGFLGEPKKREEQDKKPIEDFRRFLVKFNK